MGFLDIVNGISLLSSSIGLLILLSLAFRRPKLMKRVSLQLQTGIALLDITRHIQFYNLISTENSFCTFIAFYGFFSDHLYVFLNVAIALNLHLFLLKRYRPRHYAIWIYFIVSVIVSLVLNLIPLGHGYLGKSSKGECYLKSDIPNRHIVKFFIVHLPNWPGVIYCLIISIVVISQYIFGKIEDFDTDIVWLPEVRGLSFMISLNSLTCFVTMFFYLLNGFLFDWFNIDSQVLFDLSSFGVFATGLLNLICLLLDYQVWFAIIGDASPIQTSLSASYELNNKASTGKSEAFGSNMNPILDPMDSHVANDGERGNLINFL